MAAISCDPNDLMAAAKCYDCIPPGDQLAVQAFILDQLRIQGGGAVMTIDQLIDAARCYRCADGMLAEIMVFLLCAKVNQ